MFRHQSGNLVARKARRNNDFEPAEGFDLQPGITNPARYPQFPLQFFGKVLYFI
jgi:hypothetical protein